ncbi:hypothetical protein DFH27DRAFT_604855 [Peziza echinospora]|nr:hypothetical protein DFH27DRAFT_604855 [Peziza echinospora]
MQFSVLALSVLSVFSIPAAAVNILWIEPNYTCGATQFWQIYDANNGQCYVTGTWARSVSFQNIPSGAKGQVYTSSGCSTYYDEAGSGTHCVAAPQWGGLHAANWFYPYSRLTRRTEVQKERFGVTYTLPDGKTREIEVAKYADVEATWALVKANDYEALAQFPEFIGTSSAE